MATKKPKKPKKKTATRQEDHPTMFAWDGSIRHFEDGSMLELYTKVTPEEWEMLVEQTVQYKVFLECLKEVACPALGEPWEDDDDWFRVQLDVAVSRMRNMDPILVARHDQKKITAAYTEKMQRESKEVQKLVEEMREQKRNSLKTEYGIPGGVGDGDIAVVSNL